MWAEEDTLLFAPLSVTNIFSLKCISFMSIILCGVEIKKQCFMVLGRRTFNENTIDSFFKLIKCHYFAHDRVMHVGGWECKTRGIFSDSWMISAARSSIVNQQHQ